MLVFLNEFLRIYTFQEVRYLATYVNVFELIIYASLLYIIVKKGYTKKQLFILAAIGGLLFVGYYQSGQAAYFRAFLLIFAAKNFSFKRIVKTCRYALMSTFIIAVCLYLLGLSDSGLQRRGSIALGYGSPNVAAQIIFIMCLLWIVELGDSINYRHFIFLFIINAVSLFLTNSRTSFFLLLITPIGFEIMKRTAVKRIDGKFIRLFIYACPFLVAGFSYVTAKLLETSNSMLYLDTLLSNRIFLNYYAFKNNALTWFGQNVNLHDSSGTVYNNIRNMHNWSVTVDNTYVVSLIVMGIIPTAILLAGYVFVVKKALINKDNTILLVAVSLALYGFSESHLTEIYNNFIYFYIMSEIVPPQVIRQTEKMIKSASFRRIEYDT